MISRTILTVLLSFSILAGCSRPDNHPETTATAGFILQPEEGEVLRLGGPIGGQVIIKVDPAKTGSPLMAMGIQYVEGEIPIHLHEQEEEFLFVHRGHGVGILGEDQVPLKEGATIYIPPGTWHGFENTDDDASQIMWVVTPGHGQETHLEKMFREVGTPPGTEPKPLTPEQFADIMEKHGMKAKP